MTPNDSTTANTAEREIVITRVIDAPREQVWKAWTDPAFVMRWWGAKDITAHSAKIDLRVGGKYVFCMHMPDGQDIWSSGVFREIVPVERLVFTDNFADEQGNPVSGAEYGMGDNFPELLITVLLDVVEGGKTKMTLRHTGFPTSPSDMVDLTRIGWEQSFDKMAEMLR
ncbi:MAG: SRPBCC domain-containing protein [Anaerolineae bacterium]